MAGRSKLRALVKKRENRRGSKDSMPSLLTSPMDQFCGYLDPSIVLLFCGLDLEGLYF